MAGKEGEPGVNLFDDLLGLYTDRGARRYEIQGRSGGVTQLQHALQCAALAADAGASDALVAAALLHDLGHLLVEQAGAEMSATQDDLHQYKALPFLRPHLPAAVLEPIALHVDAKRYLCGIEPAYWAALSEGSRRSLELQGGPFDAEAAQAFIGQLHAEEAVWLRRWDDRAKDPARSVPGFSAYRPLLERLNAAHRAQAAGAGPSPDPGAGPSAGAAVQP
jgi:phosphonate degradation associated HDIG domain protein